MIGLDNLKTLCLLIGHIGSSIGHEIAPQPQRISLANLYYPLQLSPARRILLDEWLSSLSAVKMACFRPAMVDLRVCQPASTETRETVEP